MPHVSSSLSLRLAGALLCVGAFTGAGRAALAPPAPAAACIVLGFGQWAPEPPFWLPLTWQRQPPPLHLTDAPAPLAQFERYAHWRAVGPAPTLGADTLWTHAPLGFDPARRWQVQDFVPMWEAPAPDSLVLLRRAALSVGFTVAGRWHGDTLIGRAHAFSDLVTPETDPRANAYAVRYDCTASGEWPARARLERLLAADTIDLERNRRESVAERAQWDSMARGAPLLHIAPE